MSSCPLCELREREKQLGKYIAFLFEQLRRIRIITQHEDIAADAASMACDIAIKAMRHPKPTLFPRV